MALTTVPTLHPLTKFAHLVHFTYVDTNGVEQDYTDTGNPPQSFFSQGNLQSSVVVSGLNCTVTHVGSGWWLLTIAAATLTYAVLNAAFASGPPYLIMIVPGSARDFATGAWAPYRLSVGVGIPTLYPDCKFYMPVHFTTINTSGVEVDYTSAMGTPVCYFSASRDHDASVGLACTMTYISAGVWAAAIATGSVTRAALAAIAASPLTQIYFIQSVPSSSRDYALAAWKENREAQAA